MSWKRGKHDDPDFEIGAFGLSVWLEERTRPPMSTQLTSKLVWTLPDSGLRISSHPASGKPLDVGMWIIVVSKNNVYVLFFFFLSVRR